MVAWRNRSGRPAKAAGGSSISHPLASASGLSSAAVADGGDA